jgi:hypothetical protein
MPLKGLVSAPRHEMYGEVDITVLCILKLHSTWRCDQLNCTEKRSPCAHKQNARLGPRAGVTVKDLVKKKILDLAGN